MDFESSYLKISTYRLRAEYTTIYPADNGWIRDTKNLLGYEMFPYGNIDYLDKVLLF